MEQKTITLLEFNKVLRHLSNEAVSSSGKEACLNTAVITSSEELTSKTEFLREVMSCCAECGLTINSFPDISSSLNRVRQTDHIVQLEEFWEIRAFLQQANDFIALIDNLDSQRFVRISETRIDQTWPDKLFSALLRCISSTGEISDESSPGLYSIREEIRSIRHQCSKKVNESLTHSNISHYLQDEYLTISSDRYVLALKSNFKGKLQGIIHDYSQTGETCYFEPFYLTELNNNLQKLKRQEREELNRVLEYLTDVFRQAQPGLDLLLQWMVMMDVMLAKVKFARKLNASFLDISKESRALRLKNVRHPLLVLGGFDAVPVNIELDEGQHALVVSGGNAGGKTVCLKTLGLAALMALCALPVPAAEGSSIPMWNKIYVSMVSEQSVEDSLSTFTAQIDHFTKFWPHVDAGTLIILDEFGVGTDPGQGAALAQAVVDELVEKGAWVATATHFPSLKAYALSRKEVRAASVLFDNITGKPLYRLAYDQVGASLALDVARKQGLASEIISRAEEYMLIDGQKQDEIFARLNDLAVRREHKLQDLSEQEKKFQKKYSKMLSDLNREKQELISEVRNCSKQILDQWEKQKIGRKKALKEMSSLRSKLESQSQQEKISPQKCTTWEDVSPGDRFIYQPWQKQGVIQEMDDRKKQVKIDLGGISLWVRPDTLVSVQTNETQTQHTFSRAADKVMPLRLDLRGKYSDEALQELEHYLDRAVLEGRKNIEIIHGKGTGALREAVHHHLKHSPMVQSFACASEESGGAGMTEVELQ
ncbi:endonuclease MutS2 [Desulfonatronovibrio magnus]|uniref:endonuclease MutS2 n=1 Tax=Desulfonatronovibrio magnus TaxID=698827 RepID=UPI0005EBDF12|nr:endonuclease MutS2 [Desulfonatronovibrio magnus]RQD68108.1 MAG: endonuclease MutS2 [Desulfonatronovibrio sp. MSAO_Bac4]